MAGTLQNERGFFKFRYPSALQIVFVSAIWLFIIISSVILQSNFIINPTILTLFSFGLAAVAAVITIMVFRRPKGAERKFITSVENLKGSFEYQKIWALYIGLFSGAFIIGTLINGYFIASLPAAALFALNLAAARSVHRGIRIDNSGNLYFVKLNNELLIDFTKAKEVEFSFIYSERRYELTIRFVKQADVGLPSKIKIKASSLVSVEQSTHLDARLLGSFVKDKCSNLGFEIKDGNVEYDYSEWKATRKKTAGTFL